MKHRRLFRLAAAVLALCFVAGFAPAARALNPAVQSWYTADPSPVVYASDPDTLWVYTSHDEDYAHGHNVGGYNMKDYKCFSTRDMVNWTYRGTPVGHATFSNWSKPDGSAWAQQVVERNGKYYCYAPIFHNTKAWCIGVAVSDHPDGPFVDAIGQPLYDAGWSGIDPTVFIDDDGQAYMYWGNPTLYCAKLNEDMISLGRFTSAEVDPAWATVRSDGTLEMKMTVEAFGWGGDKTDDGVVDAAYQEGPWFFKRNDTYYMVYPSIVEGSGESMSYSTSPGPIGPWTYRGVILDTTARNEAGFNSYTIHGGTVDFKGHSYLFYHNGMLPGGGSMKRSIAVEEFTWNDDGTIPYIPRTTKGPAPVEALDPYELQQAETIAWSDGVRPIERDDGVISVQQISAGDSIRVMNVDFGDRGAVLFTARALSSMAGGRVELHLDSKTGTALATLDVPNTGGAWKDLHLALGKPAAGVHDLYFVFRGASNQDELFELDTWQFTEATADGSAVAGLILEADTLEIDTVAGRNRATFTVTAVYGDGRTEDVTDRAVLTGDSHVRIDGNTVTGVSYGKSTVTAAFGGKTAAADMTVLDMDAILRVAELLAEPGSVRLYAGGSASVALTAVFADGHTEDVSAAAAYSVSDPAVASAAAGTVTGKAVGACTVTAKYTDRLGGEKSAEIPVRVRVRDPFSRLEAEDCDLRIERSGNVLVDTVTTDAEDPEGHSLGYINAGDWICLNGVQFDRAAVSVTARIASQSRDIRIELRKNARDGELLGTITGATTGGWNNWADRKVSLSVPAGEPFNLYVVFANGDLDINWLRFSDHEHSYETVTVAPGCVEEGYTAERCTVCGEEQRRDFTAPLGHAWDGGTVTVAPTAETQGLMTYTCARCGAAKTRRIPRLGTTVPDDIDFIDPDCASQFRILNNTNRIAIVRGTGLTLTCTRPAFEPCKGQNEGDQATVPEEVVVIPAEGDWIATLAFDFDPSGASNGYYQFFGFYAAEGEDYQNLLGVRCGDGALQNFERHDGTVTHEDEEGVNSAPGLDTAKTYYLRIEKAGDSYTCFRSDDGETFTEMFAYESSGVNADCIVLDAYTGMTEGYKCTLKSLRFEDNGPAPCEHDYQAVVTAPTCTEAGFTTYTCAKCGDSYSGDEVPALGHDYKAVVTAPTCTAKGYTTYTCSRCGDSYVGDEVSALGHDYQTAVTAPTCMETGYTTHTCSRCGFSYNDSETAALGHDYKDGVCTRCGAKDPDYVPPFRFDDVQDESQYFFDPVYWAVEKGITTGASATKFSPDAGCTRAQVVTFLWRAAGKPEPTKTENPFGDVQPDAYYYKAVLWAVEKGITTGTSATTFRPDQTCTRGQIVTFLWRYNEQPEPKSSTNPFTDVPAGQYYYKAVLWAVEKGITKGTSADKFSPDSTCTRAQIVTFLYRAEQ